MRPGLDHAMDAELHVVAPTRATKGTTSMNAEDQVKSLRDERRKEHEEMFHGSTIRELTGLVEEVLRAHKTTELSHTAVTGTPPARKLV
jgi:hypothetical protein